MQTTSDALYETVAKGAAADMLRSASRLIQVLYVSGQTNQPAFEAAREIWRKISDFQSLTDAAFSSEDEEDGQYRSTNAAI